MSLPPVYISLTSIPSRVGRVLEENLRYLLQQDYPNVRAVVLTVPTVNMRGQVYTGTEDAVLDKLRANKKVVVVRPDYDYGPIMKYLGCVEVVKEDDALVFVCDDDQKYAPTRVFQLVKQWLQSPPNSVISNHTALGMNLFDKSFQSVFGASGVLAPIRAIRALAAVTRKTPPPCCATNDDVYVGLQFHKHGYRIRRIASRENAYVDDITHENSDALHTLYSPLRKFIHMYTCHWHYNRPKTVTYMCCVICMSIVVLYLIGFGIAKSIRATQT